MPEKLTITNSPGLVALFLPILAPLKKHHVSWVRSGCSGWMWGTGVPPWEFGTSTTWNMRCSAAWMRRCGRGRGTNARAAAPNISRTDEADEADDRRPEGHQEWSCWIYGYGSIPINTIFNGINIHLPAILMFTRGTRFWHTAIYWERGIIPKNLIFTFCKMMQLGHITIIVNKYDDWLHPIFFRHISMIFLFFLVRSLVVGQHSPWILKADQ